MLTLPPSVRIFLARGPTDMRKGIDSLCALARDVVGEDPFTGHLFGFANRRRDTAKFLVWDESGFWLFMKRLERGTFQWPQEKPQFEPVEWQYYDDLSAFFKQWKVQVEPVQAFYVDDLPAFFKSLKQQKP